jgi:hypothetical protein
MEKELKEPCLGDEVMASESEMMAAALLKEVTRLASHGNYRGVVHYIVTLSRGGLSMENLEALEKELFYNKYLETY